MEEEKTSTEVRVHQTQRKFWYRKKLLRLGSLGLIALLLIGGWIAYIQYFSGPIPFKYRNGVDFPLYFPTNLPTGYTVNKKSFQRQGEVLIFSISAPGGKNIAVSEEPRPTNLNLSQAPVSSSITLPDENVFLTPAGSAEISLWGSKYVSSLIANKTWVILNVTGFSDSDAEKVTQAFIQLN